MKNNVAKGSYHFICIKNSFSIMRMLEMYFCVKQPPKFSTVIVQPNLQN
jgi:hypothetical protein